MDLFINSLAVDIPDKVITNFDFEKILDTTDEWIRTRTGIEQRHVMQEHENSATFAISAAKKALELAKLPARELTHIFVATCTPQMLTPSMACIIAGALQINENKRLFALDINAACTGFVYGIELIRSIFCLNPNAKVLFVTSESLSRRMNYQDRSTSVLFGDAAAAVVITSSALECEQQQMKILDSMCYADGTLQDLITIGGGTALIGHVGYELKEDFFLQMQGREVYKHAIRSMAQSCTEILEKNNLAMEDVRFAVPHQANKRIIDAVYDKLEVPQSARFINVQKYGNTSASSIPLALSDIYGHNILKKQDKLLFTAFGGGLTWGSALFEVA